MNWKTLIPWYCYQEIHPFFFFFPYLFAFRNQDYFSPFCPFFPTNHHPCGWCCGASGFFAAIDISVADVRCTSGSWLQNLGPNQGCYCFLFPANTSSSLCFSLFPGLSKSACVSVCLSVSLLGYVTHLQTLSPVSRQLLTHNVWNWFPLSE